MSNHLALNQKEEQAVKAFISAIKKTLKEQLIETKIITARDMNSRQRKIYNKKRGVKR